MKLIKTTFALIAALALSACTDPAYLSGGAGDSPHDPRSPEYFEEAIGDRILFEVDQHTLTAEARGILAEQARWLMSNGEYSAIIEGHADEQGTREYNLALGARRANSVMEFLVSQGVAANRLRTVTYGKERPIEICSDEACYSQNRRAVTVVAAGGTS